MQSYTHSHNYKAFFSLAFMLITFGLSAQNATISGRLLDQENGAVIFANVALYATVDSSLAKVETSDDNGYFNMSGISEGNYYLVASYLGAPDL
ncbi:MAG: carboxypeptidase-like regulatory domain-containing protein, partial [Bacteroidota bacterium]